MTEPRNPSESGPADGQDAPRCGYVALVGRPNVGKSTLLNHLLKQKLSITSRKPQTTRYNVLGVDTEGVYQAVYVDTPGIHDRLHRQINRQMVRAATSVLRDVDVVAMLFEADRFTAEDELVLEHVRNACASGHTPALAIISKTDLLGGQDALLPVMARIAEFGLFEEVLPVAALQDKGIERLRAQVFNRLPQHAHLFPPDQVTDQPVRAMVGEIVREKLMRRLGDELPHRLAVVVEAYREGPRTVDIQADIYVETEGQKRIIIGQGGEKLKSVGTEARTEIESLIERKVMLRLWVKVKPGWTNSAAALRRMGLDG